jgi:NAD-reducing hydrogenase large subunit
LLLAVEKIETILDDPSILGTHIRAKAMINRPEGIVASEAPRGTLFHRYWVNEDGVLQKVNMLIATGQNSHAMNRTIHQIAEHFLDGHGVSPGILNRIEAGIRMFDPCLSCSTHAMGQLPLRVQLLRADGSLIREGQR